MIVFYIKHKDGRFIAKELHEAIKERRYPKVFWTSCMEDAQEFESAEHARACIVGSMLEDCCSVLVVTVATGQ